MNYGVYSANSPPYWQRLFTLTPPTNVWLGQLTVEKTSLLNISFSGVDGKERAFWRDRPEFELTFWQTFFSPFSNLISHQNGIYFQ